MSEVMPPIKPLNMTLIFIALSAIVITGIAGGIVLTVYDKDPSSFYGFFTATLATVVAFVGLGRSQSKLSENMDQVKHKVNGNLSRLIEIATQNASTRNELSDIREISANTGTVDTVEE